MVSVSCFGVRVSVMFHFMFEGERTGLVVRASDSGSGDPGSILGRSVCCFLEQETFTPQKVLVIPRNRWLRLRLQNCLPGR